MFQKSIFVLALLATTSMTNGQTAQTVHFTDQDQFNWSSQTCSDPCQPQLQCETLPCVPDADLVETYPAEPVPTAPEPTVQAPESNELPEIVQADKLNSTLEVTLTEPQATEVPVVAAPQVPVVTPQVVTTLKPKSLQLTTPTVEPEFEFEADVETHESECDVSCCLLYTSPSPRDRG